MLTPVYVANQTQLQVETVMWWCLQSMIQCGSNLNL